MSLFLTLEDWESMQWKVKSCRAGSRNGWKKASREVGMVQASPQWREARRTGVVSSVEEKAEGESCSSFHRESAGRRGRERDLF